MKAALENKYPGMYLLEKNPEGVDGDEDLADESEWKDRVVLGISWVRRTGWGVNTKISNNRAGVSETYEINATLHALIRASDKNTHKMQSEQ